MRSSLSLTAAVLLVATLYSAMADAAPTRRGRNTGRRNGSISWKTHHGKRVTVNPRFHGHGHAAPIKKFAPKVAVAKHPKLGPKHGVTKHPVTAHAKHHHKHFAFGRTFVGRRHMVAGARIVVPATTTTVLVHQPSEEVIVAPPELPEHDAAETWRVESVLDGTRLVVRREGQIQQVRLLGVSMPAVEEEACGKFLESLATGKSVYLVFDEALAPQDAQGITTAYVYLAEDGTLLNFEMIQSGRGLAEGGYEHNYTELFVAAQAEARTAARGIWASIPAPVE